MTVLIKNRPQVDTKALLEPLIDGSGVGVYLRYDSVYDQIREARKGDDETLSQGIWKTEIKKADWVLVEELCVDNLQKRSKDIQILAWLCEAWVVLDGLQGVINGFDLICDLSDKFWSGIYPLPEGEDLEHRLRIFEWLSDAVAERIMFVPLTSSQFDPNPFTLADWVSAVNLETIAKRSPEGKNLLSEAEISGKVTLSRYRKSLNLTSVEFLKAVCDQAEAARQSLERLRCFLENHCGAQTPNFLKVRSCLEDLSRICKVSIDKRDNQILDQQTGMSSSNLSQAACAFDLLNEEETKDLSSQSNNDDTVIISERSHAYKALKDIAQFLKNLDPHSPTPYLVELVATWEGKGLIEIISEIEQGTNESHRILKLLANITGTGTHAHSGLVQNSSAKQ